MTTDDLGMALDMRWWSYQLGFPSPVAGVFVRPCELRRQGGGAWSRKYLGPSFGRRTQGPDGMLGVELKLVLDDDHPDLFGIRLADVFQRATFDARPDFTDTYSPVDRAIFVDGCLALAIDEDIPGYPNASMGEEQYMVRVIALEITIN